MNFTKQERINMIYCLGASDGNVFLASRIYAQRYDDQRHPDYRAFDRLKISFEESGTVMYEKQERQKPVINEENTLSVLLCVVENPQVSTRIVSRELDISQTSVSKILRDNKFHPYHIQLLQELEGNDFERRIQFCEWVLNKVEEQPHFFDYVLFADEATFHSNGNVNKHNMHYYATENPHFRRAVDNQHRWSLNVWGGIVGRHVIGPYFFDNRVNGDTYLNFLINVLPQLLENVPLATRQRLWLLQDGAPPHYCVGVRNYLNNEFGVRWIGRGGPTAWPPRSPDLTKMDFFMWGYVKEKVYQTAPTTRDDMKIRIRRAFEEISEQMLVNVSRSFLARARLCIQENGGHIEHLTN